LWITDGLHARTDGFASLAVLLGVGGVAAGWDWADPVVGLVITGAIVAVLRQAAREIRRRLMDAVDRVGQTLRATPGVLGVGQVRLRWIGHHLRALVHADPQAQEGTDHHAALASHR
jgi:divalent metal cation (Fe/Co/Zn/Cd) transporter